MNWKQQIKAIDQSGVEERVRRFQSRSVKGEAKLTALRLALSMTDLTTLEGKDTEGKIIQLCHKALFPCPDLPDLPCVAAVCVYPNHVAQAKKQLSFTTVKVASVATAFPSGNSDRNQKLQEVRLAIDAGADEVDMVISRGKFLQGEYAFVEDEIAAVKAACGESRLKVILETGEIGPLEKIRLASDIAMAAGADFIKTSTGKIQPAATLPVTLVMLDAIADYHRKSGRMVGMKPAGGISTAKTALHYLVMLQETLGGAWMQPDWFRFGASSLVNDIVLQLLKQSQGAYASKDYISID
jgi:deoxyribose-phosphate aldolase